jgi:hypothetical protein
VAVKTQKMSTKKVHKHTKGVSFEQQVLCAPRELAHCVKPIGHSSNKIPIFNFCVAEMMVREEEREEDLILGFVIPPDRSLRIT